MHYREQLKICSYSCAMIFLFQQQTQLVIKQGFCRFEQVKLKTF